MGRVETWAIVQGEPGGDTKELPPGNWNWFGVDCKPGASIQVEAMAAIEVSGTITGVGGWGAVTGLWAKILVLLTV